ncbi:MAG: trigger factor [Cytophagales bacterium]|nr:trigger factor [Cytophagales bacterium]
MEITLEKQDALNAKIKINLVEDDYKPKVATKIKEYAKKAQINGFRPGHVPTGLIQKMYGKSIIAEEINNLLISSIQDYIKNNELQILGEPLPTQKDQNILDLEFQKEFQFTYQVGLAPEISYDLSKIKITKYNILHSEKELNETIENLRNQFGITTEADISSPDDIIHGQGTLLSTGAVYKVILPQYRVAESEKSKFVGLKLNDKITFDLRNTLGNEAATIAYTLGVDKSTAENMTGDIELVIEKINHNAPAELNEEFYNKVFRNSEIKDYDNFVQNLKKDIDKNYDLASENAVQNELYLALMEHVSVTMPVDFLKQWINTVDLANVEKEGIDEYYSKFEKGLKWNLIQNKICKDFDIQISEQDVIAYTMEMIRSQYGVGAQASDQMEESLKKWAVDYLAQDNYKNYDKISGRLLNEKVMKTVTEKVSLNVKDIAAEDFYKLQKS